MENAIITYLDSKYFNNFIKDFLPTLFNDVGYNGKLYVISYNLSQNEKRAIQTISNNIYFFEGENNKSIEVQRYYDILALLKTIDEDVIMTIDAGDVWFQDTFEEIFEICKDHIGVVAENETCLENWMGMKINQIKNTDLKNKISLILKDKPLIGSGMICCNKNTYIEISEKMIELINQLGEDYFGIDQIVFDTILYKLYDDKILYLPHTYDFVTIERLNDFYINSHKLIIDKKTNKPVKIVHNAGGNSRKWPNGKSDIKKYKPHVLAAIPTKNRYYTTLPLTLMSVIMQTVKPDKIVLIDDSDNSVDLRKDTLYQHIFSIMKSKGIDWEVKFGKKLGQHHSHQYSQELAEELVWRIDDDTYIENNVLEYLLEHFEDEKVGAVGGLIITPPMRVGSPLATGKIENSIWELTPQMFLSPNREIIEVDHLHCSFLYRKGIANYDLTLSPVAHREETIFSYSIKKAGYKLLIDKRVITWHLKNPQGGIRSHTRMQNYTEDEQKFIDMLKKDNIDYNNTRVVYLNGGLGDAIIFKKIMPEFLDKFKHKQKIIVTPHYDIFKEFINDDLKIINVSEGSVLINHLESGNIYSFMVKNNWNKEMIDAYRAMYELGDTK